MDKIEIVMAVYQGEAYIKEQVESILSNTYQNWLLSIYDDGCTDQTEQILEQYVREYPQKIRYIKNEKNLGHVKNFLTGAKNSVCNYVMFCDQDDVWNHDKIEKTYREMRRLEERNHHKVPVAVFTDAQVVDERLQEIHPSFHASGKLDVTKTDLNHLLMENKLIGCTMMINRHLIEKLEVLPQHARFHDWWIGLIAASFGTIGYLPAATLKYRQHGGNQVGNVSFAEYFVRRIKSLGDQKEAVLATIDQAKDLKKIFGNQMPKNEQEVLDHFIELETADFLTKRRLILKYGFLKTGWIRNLGLMAIL